MSIDFIPQPEILIGFTLVAVGNQYKVSRKEWGEMGKWDKVRRGMENRGLLHAVTAGVSAAVCAIPWSLVFFVFSGKAECDGDRWTENKGTVDKGKGGKRTCCGNEHLAMKEDQRVKEVKRKK